MFGPVIVRRPFLARVDGDPEHASAHPDGSFSTSAEFTAAGVVNDRITVGTGITLPSACTLVLATFNVTVRMRSSVEAWPGYAASEADLDLAMFRGRTNAFVATSHAIYDQHSIVFGKHDDGAALVNRTLLLLGRLDPPAVAGEPLQFLMAWTAAAGGGGAAHGRSEVVGALNAVTVVGV